MEETPVVTKPGWQTTEFYMAIGANVIGLLAISGVFNAADSAAIVEQFNALVGGVFGVIGNVMYIWSRASVKKAKADADAKVEIAKIGK